MIRVLMDEAHKVPVGSWEHSALASAASMLESRLAEVQWYWDEVAK
jgi:hypothetical protein